MHIHIVIWDKDTKIFGEKLGKMKKMVWEKDEVSGKICIFAVLILAVDC